MFGLVFERSPVLGLVIGKPFATENFQRRPPDIPEVMLMAALIMCQGVNLIFLDETVSDQLKLHFFRYFGTPSRSLWTMFEITFGGGRHWERCGGSASGRLYQGSPVVSPVAGVMLCMPRCREFGRQCRGHSFNVG